MTVPQFSFSDTLGIAGIAVSALFGLWAIYLTLRRVKYPASLTFVREQSVALLDDFATRIPNLAILYRDTPIDRSVVLLSGYLVNDGSVDLTPEMTEKPLTCTLPGGCAWLEFKLTGVAEDLQTKGEIISPSVLEISFGLFRRDEAFSFQALALLDNLHSKLKPEALVEKLHWSHRIASLGEVKSATLPQPETKSKIRRLISKYVYLAVVALYVFAGISTVGIGPLGRKPSIDYIYEHDGKKTNIQLSPNMDGTTTVTGLDKDREQRVHLEDMAKTGRFTPVYESHREPNTISILAGLLMILMAFPFTYQAFANDYKRYRFRRMVGATTRTRLSSHSARDSTAALDVNTMEDDTKSACD
ncbi:hypothetical protein [Paraburkholderia dinghuensis]|uniref:Uncharacterized protein n=1 Tax=Paraburkholderia dinghuensis TaxID=2305225 RepID=A0A3N6MJJ2_9BURK|nr:hypothetical protein [Paraburkholderia dinghuensis]RQH03608.1 hypothetical protein D1Y85_20225 [Paraburkholderia dinghuensis]